MPDAVPGALVRPEPGLRLLRAPNPSPMTHTGTNTWILGEGAVAVIDPGPGDRAHLRAILDALAPGETVSHILVTHAHRDHSELAPALKAATGAPVLGFGPATAGRSTAMAALAAAGLAGGGEGLDLGFAPDATLGEGDTVAGAGWEVAALWTPGHLGGHLCLAWEGALFTGDHVMGWASSLVSPPDGDLTDFMASCRRLAGRADRVFYPGHGDPVEDPAGRLAWLIAHREAREAQILDALAAGAATVAEITARAYADTPPALRPAAARNVFAHLVDLAGRGRVEAQPALGPEARFAPA